MFIGTALRVVAPAVAGAATGLSAVAIVLIRRASRPNFSRWHHKDLTAALITARGELNALAWETGGFAFGPSSEFDRIDRWIGQLDGEVSVRDRAHAFAPRN